MKAGYVIHNQRNIHFVTFTVTDWIDIFTRQVYRNIFLESLKFSRENKGLILHAYVIMSNHVHLIMQAEEGEFSDLMRDIRKFTAQMILKKIIQEGDSRSDWMLKRFEISASKNSKGARYNFWKTGFHPMEIFSESFLWQKINYLHLNPVRAGIVSKASDYLYSSASNYTRDEGLIEIDLLDLSLMKMFQNKNIDAYFKEW